MVNSIGSSVRLENSQKHYKTDRSSTNLYGTYLLSLEEASKIDEDGAPTSTTSQVVQND